MRIGTTFLVSLISGLALLTACDGGRTFNANVVGIDQIDIEGVKAFASLNATSAARAGVSGGAGETLLYAVDQQNNITLPDISCNFVFGDEITEKERQDIIDDMNAVIQTEAMYDFGPYVLIKYHLSYTSSIINTGGGKVELTQAVGFIYGAVRKSDGKAFTVINSYELNMWVDMMRYGIILRQYLTDSNAKTYMILENTCVTLTEEGNTLTVKFPDNNKVVRNIMTDKSGNVYLYDGYEIVAYNADGTTSPIKGNYWGACSVDNQIYAFSLENNVIKAYQISDKEPQMIAERSVDDSVNYPSSDAIYVGNINNELVFYGNNLIKYDLTNQEFSTKQLSTETLDYFKSGFTQYVGKYAYCVSSKGSYAELVRINLLDESKNVTKIDAPQGKTIVDNYHFAGSLASGYLRLKLSTTDGAVITHNIFGEDDLPDFSGYVVHSVIPLQ